MKAAIRASDPSVHVKVIWRAGGKIADLRCDLRSRIHELRRFQPEEIVVHLGHNNVCYHPTKNPTPDTSLKTEDQIELMFDFLRYTWPLARQHFSAPFPRCPRKSSRSSSSN